MKKILGLVLIATAVAACSGNNNNSQGTVTNPQFCNQPTATPYNNTSYNTCVPYNTTAYPYNPCVTGNGYYGSNYYNCSWNDWSNYNPNWYSYGCPAGYIPAQSGVAGTGGFTCVHHIFFQNFYGRLNLYYPSQYNWGAGYTGIGPLQYCDTYTNNSCGSAAGMRCVSNGQRYGFCTL